jgi:hypothetical protein
MGGEMPGWKVASAARKGLLDLARRQWLCRRQELIAGGIGVHGRIDAARATIDVPLVGVKVRHV